MSSTREGAEIHAAHPISATCMPERWLLHPQRDGLRLVPSTCNYMLSNPQPLNPTCVAARWYCCACSAAACACACAARSCACSAACCCRICACICAVSCRWNATCAICCPACAAPTLHSLDGYSFWLQGLTVSHRWKAIPQRHLLPRLCSSRQAHCQVTTVESSFSMVRHLSSAHAHTLRQQCPYLDLYDSYCSDCQAPQGASLLADMAILPGLGCWGAPAAAVRFAAADVARPGPPAENPEAHPAHARPPSSG